MCNLTLIVDRVCVYCVRAYQCYTECSRRVHQKRQNLGQNQGIVKISEVKDFDEMIVDYVSLKCIALKLLLKIMYGNVPSDP